METPLGVVPARMEFSWEKLSGSVVWPENSQKIGKEVRSLLLLLRKFPLKSGLGTTLSPAFALNLPRGAAREKLGSKS